MSKVSAGRKQHRSMRGKVVDMDLLRKRNELTPAVGNAKVNARGDELGPGGKIIRKREDIVKEHYAQAGRARPDSGAAKPKVAEAVEETVTLEKPVARRTTRKAVVQEPLTTAEEELLQDDADWIEDDNGNFIPKGE
jgi:hypothetical protein